MSVPPYQPPSYETYPTEPPPMFVPAPFWRRLLARLIDFAIAVPITFLAIVPVFLVLLPVLLLAEDDAASDIATSVGAFTCFVIAYALIEYFLLRRRSGQTLGKGLLGLRVVPAGVADQAADRLAVPYAVTRDGRASAISGLSALVRMLIVTGPFLLSIALFYATSGADAEDPTPLADAVLYLWIGSLLVSTVTVLADRGGRRGLHDMAARTRVVRTQRRGVDVRSDLRMLVPGRVSLEKDSPTVTLWKQDPR